MTAARAWIAATMVLLTGCNGGEAPPAETSILVLTVASVATVPPSVDVSAMIDLPETIGDGQTIIDAPFAFANAGATTAVGMTYAIRLPAGLDEVRVETDVPGATADYDTATGEVRLFGLPGRLSPGARVSGALHFLTPLAAPLAAIAAVSTASGQGVNRRRDVARVATAAIRYDPPVVIRAGGTYSGNWRSDDPAVPAVKIVTDQRVVIDSANIVSRGDAITAPDGNTHLIVRNVNARATQPRAAGTRKGMFVNAGNFATLTVEHNHVVHFNQGVRALNFGARINRTGQRVMVRYNIFKDIDGRLGDGAGGYVQQPATSAGQAIGLNHLRAATVEIAWNQIINTPYQTHSEDLISTFESSGTAARPIDIHDNYIENDFPTDPAIAFPFTGCGIQIGDAPDKDDVGFTNAHDNQIVGIANCGIGISAGHDQHVYNNRVVSAQYSRQNVLIGTLYRSPFGLWDYYFAPDPSVSTTPGPYWYNNSIYDNVENVVDRDGNVASDYIVNGSAATRNNINTFGHPATVQDEIDEHRRWLRKRRTSPEPLGPIG